jgi:hypothetical protein
VSSPRTCIFMLSTFSQVVGENLQWVFLRYGGETTPGGLRATESFG